MNKISLKQFFIYIILIFNVFFSMSFAEKIKDGLSDNSNLIFTPTRSLFNNIDYGIHFSTDFNLKDGKTNDFNKGLSLKFKKDDNDILYFSFVNYNNFLNNKTRKFNSKNLSKNYYSFYFNHGFNTNNEMKYGFSFGYLPLEKITIARYMLFLNLYSKFELNELFNTVDLENRWLFVNIMSLNTSILKANKNIYNNKKEEYSKFKDLLFIIYKFDEYFSFKNVISYTYHFDSKQVLKSLGFKHSNTGKVQTGIEFRNDYLSIYPSVEKLFRSSEYKFNLSIIANY